MTDSKPYRVKVRSEGLAGWIDYLEDTDKMSFPWERTTAGFTIELPYPNEWDSVCTLQNALWALGRRDLIVGRVGSAASREYWGGTFEDKCHYLDVKRPPSVLKRLFTFFRSS